MQRITKRNEQGGIEIDGITLALEKLAEYEDIGDPPDFMNYKFFYEHTVASHSCNDCGKTRECEYCAGYGDYVRWNCAMWAPEDEAEKNIKAWEDIVEENKNGSKDN